MANKTYNIYCDESCHLEHDHKRFMFLGSVSSAFPQVRRHSERIKELKKKHNFYAGPSILSQYTLDKSVEAIRDFAGTGLSILEISHRSKEFVAVMDGHTVFRRDAHAHTCGYDKRIFAIFPKLHISLRKV